VRAFARFDPSQEGLPVRAAGEISDLDYLSMLPGLEERHAAKYSREIRRCDPGCRQDV
jgi:3-oxoacyl-[acyl-carrier-protein] synthase II